MPKININPFEVVMRTPLVSSITRFMKKIAAHRNAGAMHDEFFSHPLKAAYFIQQEPSRPTSLDKFLSPLRRLGL